MSKGLSEAAQRSGCGLNGVLSRRSVRSLDQCIKQLEAVTVLPQIRWHRILRLVRVKNYSARS
jgi:hypothetical protein